MTRITPRTCLYPLTGSLLLTFGLSIALTYRSNHHCYAAVCGEWLFPLEARLHVVVWYFWLAISVTILGVRAFQPEFRRFLTRPLVKRKLPVLGKSLAISGLLVCLWILALYGMLIGVWWVKVHGYFRERGGEGGVYQGNNKLAAIAQTGHLADVSMGMALIPVSRHSALGSFFKLSHSTTLSFHQLTAYMLFVLTIIHTLLYVSWVPDFHRLSETMRMVFPVLNPTYLYHETWPGNHSSLGVWRASLIFSGIVGTTIFSLIFITTLPKLRNKHFNVFYFTHFTAIIAVIVLCLHASTIFYCCAPGLAMWALDWGMRFYELRQKIKGKIQFLFRKSSNKPTPPAEGIWLIKFCRGRTKKPQWTSSIASIVDNEMPSESIKLGTESSLATTPTTEKQTFPSIPVGLRLEGPYFTPADPAMYRTVVCLVAGTGVSGGIAIANAFANVERKRAEGRTMSMSEDRCDDCGAPRRDGKTLKGSQCVINAVSGRWEKCIVMWSVREEVYVDLPFFHENPASTVDIRTHLTGKDQPRLDMNKMLGELDKEGGIWVYISGPPPFIAAAEKACKETEGVEYYAARWDI